MPNYGDPGYWDQRYKEQEGTTFDWLEDFESIRPLIEQVVQPNLDTIESTSKEGNERGKLKILNLGCGNSVMCEEMYDQGFTEIYNVDISDIVI